MVYKSQSSLCLFFFSLAVLSTQIPKSQGVATLNLEEGPQESKNQGFFTGGVTKLSGSLSALLSRATGKYGNKGSPIEQPRSINKVQEFQISSPSFDSGILEKLEDNLFTIYNEYKKVFYNGFCRSLTRSPDEPTPEVIQEYKTDGALPFGDTTVSHITYVKRERIADAYADSRCNFYLKNQLKFMKKRDKVHDNLSILSIKEKKPINLKLKWHSQVGMYYDTECNWYLDKTDPTNKYSEIAEALKKAQEQGVPALKTPNDGWAIKMAEKDIWIDISTCDLWSHGDMSLVNKIRREA